MGNAAMGHIRWRTAPVLAVAALLSACAATTPRVSIPPPERKTPSGQEEKLVRARATISTLQQEKARLEKMLRKTRKQNQELQLQLLDNTALVHQLKAQREQAIEEVVQTKARLRSRQSKAETVANLAEVKLILQGAAARGTHPESMQALAQARELVHMAEQALNEDNLEGASYLMAEARQLLSAPAGSGAAATGRRRQGEILFATPFAMEVRRKGNVRLEPGLQSKVLFQLDSGDRVQVLGRRGTWLHIRTGDRRTGWMHYNLLATPH
jgi:hypothetical protein